MPPKKIHPHYDCECGERLTQVSDANIQSHIGGAKHKEKLKKLHRVPPMDFFHCPCGITLKSVSQFQVDQHQKKCGAAPPNEQQEGNAPIADPVVPNVCECGKDLTNLPAIQITQHKASKACTQKIRGDQQRKIMDMGVVPVPRSFAWGDEGEPNMAPPPPDYIGEELEDMEYAEDALPQVLHCPGYIHPKLPSEVFWAVYPFAIHRPQGVPACPAISWHLGNASLVSLSCTGYMADDGRACCEHCEQLAYLGSLDKVVSYAVDAKEHSNYLRLGCGTLASILHRNRQLRDSGRLSHLNLQRKVVSQRGLIEVRDNLLMAIRSGKYPRVAAFLDQQMCRGRSLTACLAMLQDAMTPQLTRKYTDLEMDLALLTFLLGGWNLLHSFNRVGLLPSSPFLNWHERLP